MDNLLTGIDNKIKTKEKNPQIILDKPNTSQEIKKTSLKSILDKIFFNVLTRLICENGLTWTIYDGIFYDDESSSISPSTSSEIFNYIFISGSRDY